MLAARIIAVEEPVTAVNRTFHLFLHLCHTGADAVGRAGSVGNNHGRSLIALSLLERPHQLRWVGAHRHLGDIDVAVSHQHGAEILFAAALAGRSKLRHRADRCRLGALTAGVGIDLGINDNKDFNTDETVKKYINVYKQVLKY